MQVSENLDQQILNIDEQERYQRHISLREIGIRGQISLKNSSVIFVGAGGLGSSAILYGAAAGIGTIGLIDNDKIDKSNLQRQVIHDTHGVGKHKIFSAKSKIEKLNPNCKIITYLERLNPNNILNIFKNFDIICDCSDNFGTRYLINDACLILEKPFIFGSVQGFEGQVSVFNLNKKSPNLRDLIPKSPSKNDIPSCKDFGVLGVSPGLIGILQTNELIKIIIKKGEILDGKLLIFNLLNLTMKKLTLKKGRNNRININNLFDQKDDYEVEECINANLKVTTIENIEFMKIYENNSRQIIIIDVRETKEFEEYSLKGSISIPLTKFNDDKCLNFIKTNFSEKKIYTLCQKGSRSKKASSILMQNNIESVSIEGGLEKIKL